MFVVKSNRPGFETVTLTTESVPAAIAEAETLLPANPDAWARFQERWVGLIQPGQFVPAAWNVTLAPHGTAQLWIEQTP